MKFTYLIIGFTVLISVSAFSNNNWFHRYQFSPYQVHHQKQYYRLFTHGFLHVNWVHLIVNMLVLFFFGGYGEDYIKAALPPAVRPWSPLIYFLFYFTAIIVASLSSLKKHKDDEWYNAVGASGAVSAVLFLYIFFNPWERIYFYGIIPIPGIVMGVLYLLYSHYMSRRGTDMVNHDAHIAGAIFGFIFPVLLNYRLLAVFFKQFFNFSF